VRVRIPNGWAPRDYQRSLWSHLQGGGKRADVVAHRRWGKDDVALHWAAVAAFQRVGSYWHCLPEYAQARKAIWDAVNPHTGKRRIDEAFPDAICAQKRDQDMFIRFKNGSSWQVVGSDNYDRLVGASLAGVVYSEWSLAKPEAWTYMSPILEESGGWALFIWTPRGRNHATRAFEGRELDKANWFTQRMTALQTGVFDLDQLDKQRQQYIDECGSEEEGDAKFRQEYLVDFEAAVPGSYFGPQLHKAQDEGRIGQFGHVARLPVDTAWDIGVDDYSAVWFFQDNGRRVRAIAYFETSGEGAEQIVRACMPEMIPDPIERRDAMQAIGRTVPFTYRNHFLPHDVMNREWGAGAKSRLETLTALGLKRINVGVARNPADRINASRRLMPVVCFDAKACETGLDRLRNYRRRFNKSLGVYGEPLHDENSHGADAFGEYAVNSRLAVKIAEQRREKPADEWADDGQEGRDGWKVL
jgi:hypothetical protein